MIITGASTGIGEACALRLDNAGWRVFAGVRKDADGERLRGKASGRLTPLMLDVTDAQQIAAAKETVAAAELQPRHVGRNDDGRRRERVRLARPCDRLESGVDVCHERILCYVQEWAA